MNEISKIDFLLPTYIDHDDRKRNLEIAINYLKKIGSNNYFINEYYKDVPKISNIDQIGRAHV